MIDKLLEWIRESRNITITTHMNPDGDGLGSELALSRQLREAGKRVRVLNCDPVPERYRFLDPDEESEVFQEDRDAAFIRDCDLLFVLDNSSMNRMGRMEEPIRTTNARKICIDHHVMPGAEEGGKGGENPWDLLWNVPETAATGELVFQLIVALGGPMTLAKAEPLYVTLVTDTGNFRFSKTNSQSHEIAAQLLACGVNPVKVYQEIFERNSVAFMRLLGYALTNFQEDCDGRLVWVTMNRARITDNGAEEEDTSEMVNFFFQIYQVRMAILFKELPGGKTKVSLRSKGDLDVNRLAVQFGGGGHRNASGIVVDLPLDRATETILGEARKMFPGSPTSPSN
ncbi:MAG: bifunctional oligoribonuclease/PAP phosphatase NrnA [Acidobacteriota bacterium]